MTLNLPPSLKVETVHMILGAFNEYRASLDPPLLHRLLFENVARGLPNVAVSKQNAHSITPPLAAYSGLQVGILPCSCHNALMPICVLLQYTDTA